MKIPVPVKILVPAASILLAFPQFAVPANADECNDFHNDLAQVSKASELAKIVKNVVYANIGMTFFVEKNFAIGNYEISQEEYEFIMGENPSNHKDRTMPVENVSWHDAMKFCEKLTKYAREEKLITDLQTFRLPTSEEWEYACTMGHYIEKICHPERVAWVQENSKKKTHSNKESLDLPQKKIFKDCSLYNMLGNVAEWCSSPAGTGRQRIFRGGSFANPGATACDPYLIFAADPDYTSPTIGFRVCMTLLDSTAE